eukprot:TRINITY_DN3411_c0_g1_i3.p1 TRINITY_DN3411_c0_g1~~TRINITY_DN3411_c0_g1_i3.p1  ORF type:complete len:280 (+),score=61.19 TRINITY_DN3411_c0_g1_i3:173-1012(+)
MTSWGVNMDRQQALDLLNLSISLGMTTIDTADIYGGYTVEALLGSVLAANPQLRPQIKIITKCGIIFPCQQSQEFGNTKMYNTSKQHILLSVNRSLVALNCGYIDLLLIHRPDPFTHPEEIADALVELKKLGHVKKFGVSNYSPLQLSALLSYLPKDIPLEVNQIQFSLICTQPLFDGTFDYLLEHRIKPQIWSPLGGGLIFQTESHLLAKLKEIAFNHSTTPDIIALAWILCLPSRPSVIVGTTRPERLATYPKALEIVLTREEWFQLLEVARGHEIL